MFSLLFFHDHVLLIDWALDLWHSFAWASIDRVFQTSEGQSTRQQGPLSLISANRCLQPLISVYPINCEIVTVLWCPWVSLKRGWYEYVCFHLTTYWMSSIEVCWSRLSAWSWQECSTVLLPWVAVRKTFSGNISFSLTGQHPCFVRISLFMVCGQAQLDMECWDWYPRTLLYLSYCKNFVRLLHLVCYLGASMRSA